MSRISKRIPKTSIRPTVELFAGMRVRISDNELWVYVREDGADYIFTVDEDDDE